MRSPCLHHWRPRGFTLVELLVTLVILGILASASMPMVQLAFRRHKEEILLRSLNSIRDALDAYKQAAVQGHIAVDPLDSGYPPNLTVLVTGVDDALSPTPRKLYFLRRIPSDPFADDAVRGEEDTWGKRSYESDYRQPREGSDVFDVHSRSSEIGLNGIPYSEW